MKRFTSLFLITSGLVASGLAAAAPASAPTSAMTLTFTSQLQKIEGGKLVTAPVKKTWTLPAKWVARSKQYGKVTAYLDPVFDQVERTVNKKVEPAMFREVTGGWVATEQPEWKVDRVATKQKVMEAILSGQKAAEVVFNETKPERTVAQFAERGVLHHLSMARSFFAGSPDFRVTNIVAGAEKFDYLFIAPGSDFDFNKTVGAITKENGFVPGYIISGGTLALEEGGGICQVSTTAFRALWQAGLPIVERQQHSHRVKYYDPVGYEATVYAPHKNLRMKNDTGQYLYLQVTWNTNTKRLRFDVFGTDTGRKATISEPIISDIKPPASPSYTPDDRVKLGGQRLLDEPMEGMTSVITRTVSFPDGTTKKDSIRSVYQPWGAVYGVHPDDPRLKKNEQAKK